MAYIMGLSKIAEKAIEKAKQKITEKKQEVKEKVNPMSQTNKANRAEHKREQQEERQAERDAYLKERRHQIEERGKRAARHEVSPPSSSSGRKSVKGAIRYASRTPKISPVGDPYNFVNPAAFSIPGSRKPKPTGTSKTTTIHTNGQTIKITQKNPEEEQQKKKKQDDWAFLDPFKF